jgi:hypothetical protein
VEKLEEDEESDEAEEAAELEESEADEEGELDEEESAESKSDSKDFSALEKREDEMAFPIEPQLERRKLATTTRRVALIFFMRQNNHIPARVRKEVAECDILFHFFVGETPTDSFFSSKEGAVYSGFSKLFFSSAFSIRFSAFFDWT